MSTPSEETKARRSVPGLPLSTDVHQALKLRAAMRNQRVKEVADEVLRAALAGEIKQLEAAAA